VRDDRVRAPVQFTAAFVGDLLDVELDAVDPDLRARAVAWVLARIDGAAQPARIGLLTAATLLALGIRATQGAPYQRLPDERRRAVVARLTAAPLPIVADWVRAMRALSLSYYYEAREGFTQ
jgi:hypothetical protein